MLGRLWGLLGADIDAGDVSALRVRAAIVVVVAVSAGLPPPGGRPGTPGR